MAMSDAILTRLLTLHPKIIDLDLVRMERILDRLGHPEIPLPQVVHRLSLICALHSRRLVSRSIAIPRRIS